MVEDIGVFSTYRLRVTNLITVKLCNEHPRRIHDYSGPGRWRPILYPVPSVPILWIGIVGTSRNGGDGAAAAEKRKMMILSAWGEYSL